MEFAVCLGAFTVLMTFFIVIFSPHTMAATIQCGGPSCQGTTGDDYIYSIYPYGSTLQGIGGNDYIIGSNGRDIIQGGSGLDTILGNNGDDNIDGGSESDKIDGGDGNDYIFGGGGNDDIAGGQGSDHIQGDTNQLTGGYYPTPGSDKIYGGDGDDDISSATGTERDFRKDYIDCGAGSDSVSIRSSDADFVNSNCENITNSDK